MINGTGTTVASISDIVRRNRDQLSDYGITAVSVGGSLSRGDANNHSDVDLFILVREISNPKLNRGMQEFARFFGDVLVFRGPVWVDGFGYSHTAVYEDGLVVQLNLNSCGSLEPDCFVRSGLILFDDHGEYEEFLSQSQKKEFNFLNEYFDKIEYIAIRLLFAIRSISGGRNLLALTIVGQIREAVIAVYLCKSETNWAVRQYPSKNYGKLDDSLFDLDIINVLSSCTSRCLLQCVPQVLKWLDNECASGNFVSEEIRLKCLRSLLEILVTENNAIGD